MGRYFHRGVDSASGRAANHERNFFQAKVIVLLHLGGHVLHLFQARRDQTGQAHNIRSFSFSTG